MAGSSAVIEVCACKPQRGALRPTNVRHRAIIGLHEEGLVCRMYFYGYAVYRDARLRPFGARDFEAIGDSIIEKNCFGPKRSSVSAPPARQLFYDTDLYGTCVS